MKKWLFKIVLHNIWRLIGEHGDQSAKWTLFGNCLVNKINGECDDYYANMRRKSHLTFPKWSIIFWPNSSFICQIFPNCSPLSGIWRQFASSGEQLGYICWTLRIVCWIFGENSNCLFLVKMPGPRIVAGIFNIFKTSGELSANRENVWQKRKTLGGTCVMFENDWGNITNLALANIAKYSPARWDPSFNLY